MSTVKGVVADRTIGLIASLAGIFSYIAFRDSVWGFAIGLGVAYTIYVLGQVIAEKIFYPDFLAVQMSWGKILLMHAGFLVVVVGFIWALYFVRSLDPDSAPHVKGHIDWDFIVAIVVATVLGALEKWMILGKRDKATV